MLPCVPGLAANEFFKTLATAIVVTGCPVGFAVAGRDNRLDREQVGQAQRLAQSVLDQARPGSAQARARPGWRGLTMDLGNRQIEAAEAMVAKEAEDQVARIRASLAEGGEDFCIDCDEPIERRRAKRRCLLPSPALTARSHMKGRRVPAMISQWLGILALLLSIGNLLWAWVSRPGARCRHPGRCRR